MYQFSKNFGDCGANILGFILSFTPKNWNFSKKSHPTKASHHLLHPWSDYTMGNKVVCCHGAKHYYGDRTWNIG